MVLDAGRVAFDGDLATLSRQVTGKRAVEIHVDPHTQVDEARVATEIAPLGAETSGRTAGALTVVVDAERLAERVPVLFATLDVRDVSVERQPLEHLVKEIYRRSDRAGAGLRPARGRRQT